eukprot:5614453-Amphidinium_carterae.1
MVDVPPLRTKFSTRVGILAYGTSNTSSPAPQGLEDDLQWKKIGLTNFLIQGAIKASMESANPFLMTQRST